METPVTSFVTEPHANFACCPRPPEFHVKRSSTLCFDQREPHTASIGKDGQRGKKANYGRTGEIPKAQGFHIPPQRLVWNQGRWCSRQPRWRPFRPAHGSRWRRSIGTCRPGVRTREHVAVCECVCDCECESGGRGNEHKRTVVGKPGINDAEQRTSGALR
jgi:hypothetical protein